MASKGSLNSTSQELKMKHQLAQTFLGLQNGQDRLKSLPVKVSCNSYNIHITDFIINLFIK
jgi:hypothetical protein